LRIFAVYFVIGLRKSIGNCRFNKIKPRPAYFPGSRTIVNCCPADIQRVLSFSAILAFYDICMSPTMAAIVQAAAIWPELANLKKRMLN
jgi:hypothetical protein